MAELSTVAEDYVKAIWSATEWGGRPATVTTLARRFQTTTATASDTVKRLAQRGLVEHEPYGALTLTADGEAEALRMVRRHRLVETFLVELLGYRWHEVHDEAELLEHSVSELFVERIDALLGHPGADPHGDPIPDAAGRVHYPADALPLSEAADGDFEVVRVSDEDPGVLVDLAGLGVSPGSAVVRSGGEVRLLQAPGRPARLDRRHQAALIVAPRR